MRLTYKQLIKWIAAFRLRPGYAGQVAGMTLVVFLLLSAIALADSGDNLLLGTAAQPKGKVDLLQGSPAPANGKTDLLKEAPAPADGKMDPRVCQALVKHTPSADTAYQPGGVDVNGNSVAPADLPGSPQMKLPDKIQIPLTFSLAKVLNLNTSQFPNSVLGPGTEGNLGTLTVEGDNVSFNGQPLTDAQQDNLAVLCMKPN